MKRIVANLVKAHGLFIMLALVFGAIFITITPPFWGADEGQHFIRAYQVSQGHISQQRVTIDGTSSEGGAVPKSLLNLDRLRQKDIGDAVPGETRQVDSRKDYSTAANKTFQEGKLFANPYGKITYQPFTYAAPTLGIVIANLFSNTALPLLYSARAATLLFYIVLVTTALCILRKYSLKWLVFAIGLLPMSIFQASTVNADSLLLGFSLILFSLAYVYFYTSESFGKVRLGLTLLAGVLLTAIKPPYVILPVALLALLPIKRKVSPKQKQLVRTIIPMSCIIVAVLCLVSSSSAVANPLPGVSVSSQIHWIILHPLRFSYIFLNSILVLDWVPQVIGLFGSSFVFVPGLVFQVLLIGLAFLTLVETRETAHDSRDINKKSAAVLLVAAAATTSAIIVTLYLDWTPVGWNLVQGVQGRYFLPVVAFLLLGVRSWTTFRLKTTDKQLAVVCTVIATASLLISSLWYFRILY
jgi:uncharacterized membrane protein